LIKIGSKATSVNINLTSRLFVLLVSWDGDRVYLCFCFCVRLSWDGLESKGIMEETPKHKYTQIIIQFNLMASI